MLKQCSRCGQTKKLEEFHKRAASIDGLCSSCKVCRSSELSSYYQKKRESIRERHFDYYYKNTEKILDQKKGYNERNRERRKARDKEYLAKNKEIIRVKKRARYYKNREKIIAQKAEYFRRKWKEDHLFRLKESLRTRVYCAIRGSYKSGSAVRDLGCSIEELKRHLESKFNSRMNWKNWGTYWSIDHFFPLAEADLEDRVEFLAVNNWRNLQPLTVAANRKKGDKVYPEARELFEKLKAEFEREAAA